MAKVEIEDTELEALKTSIKKLEDNSAELKAEKEKERDKVKAAEAKAAAAQEKLDAADKEKLKGEKDVEKVRTAMQKEIDAEKAKTAAAEEKASAATGKLNTVITERQIDTDLKAQGVPDNMLKAARLMIQSDQKIETGDDGKVTIDGKSSSEFLKGWAESDAGSGFVVDGNGGGGAGGGGGGGGKKTDQQKSETPGFAGSREDRVKAVGEMFPDLPD